MVLRLSCEMGYLLDLKDWGCRREDMKGSWERSVWLKLSRKKEMFLDGERFTCGRPGRLSGDRS